MAKLVVHRKFELGYGLRGFSILIDGEEKELLGMNAKKEFELSPGTYSVQAKVDWTSSPVHTFRLAEGEEYHLNVSAGGKFTFFLLLCLVAVSFGELGLLLSNPAEFFSIPLHVILLIAVSLGFLVLLVQSTVGRKSYLIWQYSGKGKTPEKVEML